MAYKKVTVTPTDLYSLEIKGRSKLLHTLPAISDAKSTEEVAPKTAYWPIYTCVQAKLAEVEDEGDRILQVATKNFTNAEMRRGFIHTETGRAIAQVWKTSPQPGDALNYKVAEFIRIFEEAIEEDPVKLRVAVNTKSFQYIEGFTDVEHYSMVMDQIATTGATALKDAMKTFIYSVLLGGNTKAFIKNYYMERLWGKNLQLTDEQESKDYKAFYDTNGEFKKLCKQAAGEFQAKFKNKRFFDPAYSTTWDFERKGEYKIDQIQAATSDADLKTKLQTRYTAGGNDKTKPPKWITRDQCIWAMCEQITQAVSDLTRIPAVENCMEYDPFKTAQATEKQLPCRCTKDDLMIVGNPHDLAACVAGAAYTSPGGTGSKSIAGLGVDIFYCDGFLPGEVYIFDKRAINIFPYYKSMFKNMNGWDLVDQTFFHFQFKWGIFRYFAGVQLHATRWCPHPAWISEFQKELTAA